MLQIDVISINTELGLAISTLSYNGRDIRILMSIKEYEDMKEEGLFIRDGKSKDSAGVINTTKTFTAID